MKSLEQFIRSLLEEVSGTFRVVVSDVGDCEVEVYSRNGDLLFHLYPSFRSVVLYFNVPSRFDVKLTISADAFVDSYYEVVRDVLLYFARRSEAPVSEGVVRRCISELRKDYMIEMLTGL